MAFHPNGSRRKNAGKRKNIEECISSHNVEFTYEGAVPTSEFDIDKSQANQARFKQLDRNVVEQYKDAILRGDQFPAVVAHRPSARGKLIITDGNHRLAAHNELRAPIDVYVLGRVRGVTLTSMTYEANTRHGLPTSVEERVTQAVWLIDSGATHEAAAAAVNVRLAEVKRAWSKAQSERRADEVGIVRSEWDTLAMMISCPPPKSRLFDGSMRS